LQGVGGAMAINAGALALWLMSQLLNWEFQGTNGVQIANGTIVMEKTNMNAFTLAIGWDANNSKHPSDHPSLV